MTNAEKFTEHFGIYATQLRSMSEKEFLKWLIRDADNDCYKLVVGIENAGESTWKK